MKFNIGCLVGTFIFAALLLCSSCVTPAPQPPCFCAEVVPVEGINKQEEPE